MKAMILTEPRTLLTPADVPDPSPGPGQILIKVHTCAVCRTDLHVIDGELPNPKLPLIPGHEIIGTVAAKGAGVDRFAIGDRVGVPWLGWSCGACAYLPLRPGKPVRQRPLHRLPDRRRIRRTDGGRRPLLLPHSGLVLGR